MYKSENDKVICGVCGGIAEYFDINPTLVRLGWAAVSIVGGLGILPYFIVAIIIPRRLAYADNKY